MKPFGTLLLALLVLPAFAPCQAQSHDAHAHATVSILATDYALQAPGAIASGWTTIQFANEGNEPHFLFVARLPEERTYDEYASAVLPHFNDVWYALRDEGMSHEQAYKQLGANIPEWYWNVEYMGGSGIIPAGQTTEVTLNLDPGTYVLECYMKTEDGELHYMEGMLRELVVIDTPSHATPPRADVQITLSNFEMAFDGTFKAGKQTVAVHVVEHPEEGFGHNVHVARLEPGADKDEIIRWMNFMEVDGLRPPAPVPFVGGMHILPEGATGYFTVDLEPGRYLFLSEYTAPFGVYREVTVEP